MFFICKLQCSSDILFNFRNFFFSNEEIFYNGLLKFVKHTLLFILGARFFVYLINALDGQ